MSSVPDSGIKTFGHAFPSNRSILLAINRSSKSDDYEVLQTDEKIFFLFRNLWAPTVLDLGQEYKTTTHNFFFLLHDSCTAERI